MINALANKLEEQLNSENMSGLTFSIVADTGEYRHQTRVGNDETTYVNGLMKMIGSDVCNSTETAGLILIINTQVTMIMPCDDEEDANTQRVGAVREVIDNLIKNSHVQINDMSFQAEYSLGISGERITLPNAGDCYSFVLYITYNYVVNGVNSKHCRLKIAGEFVDYQQFIPTRNVVQDSSVYSKSNGEAITIANGTTFGITVDAPLLSDNLGRYLSRYLLKGETLLFPVYIKIGELSEGNYLMGFDNGHITSQALKNIGAQFDMSIRKAENGALFPLEYTVYKATQENAVLVINYRENRNAEILIAEQDKFISTTVKEIFLTMTNEQKAQYALDFGVNEEEYVFVDIGNFNLNAGCYVLLKETPVIDSENFTVL